MKTSSLVSAAALLASANAATVTMETTKCLNVDYPFEKFEIEMNLSGPVARDLPHICGLRILSASEGVDVNTIRCQAFKDVVGTQPGSAIFTYASPALIATNPVQIMAIGCKYPVLERERRQVNLTASMSSMSSSQSVPVSTVLSTVTLSTSSASESRSTATTSDASASSGMPSSSANATMSTMTLTPSASQTSATPSQSTGAAGAVGVGMGVVAAAVMAML